MGNVVQLSSADGFEFGAYVAEPAGTAKAAVVVIQEIFGVNDHIREVVDGYADAGYYAVAPMIFDRIGNGIELGYTDQDMAQGVELAFQKLQMPTTLKDLQATIDHAGKQGKVGVVGYCFGGLLTWLSACNLSGIDAASAYYGGGIAGQLDHSPNCPTILHFGDQDAHIPMADVDKIRAAQPEVEVHVYGADHGFNCDHRATYHADSAKLAKNRTLEHFARHLA